VDRLEPFGVPRDADRTVSLHAAMMPRAVRIGRLSPPGTGPEDGGQP
jgi:hypothetical protein